MKSFFVRLIKSDGGQGLVEYGLIISLVILGVIFSVHTFGGELKLLYNDDIIEKMP